MGYFLHDEQVELFGEDGAVLDMLAKDMLRLFQGVGRRDPSEVDAALTMLVQDVGVLRTGLMRHKK